MTAAITVAAYDELHPDAGITFHVDGLEVVLTPAAARTVAARVIALVDERPAPTASPSGSDTDPGVRLSLLSATSWRATEHLAPTRSAVALFDQASEIAERDIPGPLGLAVAEVLALAASRRRATRMGGILGESRSMLALALAVIGGPQ